MATARLILALDQGTTSSRAIAFEIPPSALGPHLDAAIGIRGVAQQEFPQYTPSPSEVEHDPEAIWDSQLSCARRAIAEAGGAEALAAIGITNQRETTILWDRATGKPCAPAIVWQSRITAGICEEYRAGGHEAMIRRRTGLLLDPYFSATKIVHLLRKHPSLRAAARRGEVLFGTVESFLLWRLTGGRVHATDVTNAARTLLFDIHEGRWSGELCDLFDVPPASPIL